MPRSWSARARRAVATVASLALVAAGTALIAAPAATAAPAADCTPSATNPCVSAGTGTAADPYRIATWQDLDNAAAAVALADQGGGVFLGALPALAKANFVVTADIDYSAAGHDFAGFPLFGGTFDGAGHTISNIAYGLTTGSYKTTSATAGSSANSAAFFWYTNNATVKNLRLDHATITGSTVDLDSTSGDTIANTAVHIGAVLIGWQYAGTVTGNTIENSAIVTGGGSSTTHDQAAVLVANLYNTYYNGTSATAGTTTISDNVIWHSKATGNKYAGGLNAQMGISNTGGWLYVRNNLINATVVERGNANGGANGIAAIIDAQGPNSATVTSPMLWSGNVVYGGGAYTDDTTYVGRTNSNDTDTTVFLGTANSYCVSASAPGWHETDNLVSDTTSFEYGTLTADGVTYNTNPASKLPAGCRAADGTTPAVIDAGTSDATSDGKPNLAARAAYAAAGWDFDNVWDWDAANHHPVLPAAPLLEATRTAYAVAAPGARPSDATLLGWFGARIGGTGDAAALTVDTSAVTDWSAGGSYPLVIGGSDGSGTASPLTVTLTLAALPGRGTPTDPYRISTRAQLDQAAALVGSDGAAQSASFVLTDDIDYGGGTFAGFGTYKGTFDGAGHTVHDIAYAVSASGDAGFFQSLNGATVQDLVLDGVTAEDESFSGSVGGVAARASSSTITGVQVLNSSIALGNAWPTGTSNGQAAGIVGNTSTATTITDNVVRNTTITATRYAAALVTNPGSTAGLVADNLIDATIQVTAGGGTSAFLTAQGTNANLRFDGNVVAGGAITVLAGTSNTFAAGQNGPAYGTNPVSSAVTLGGTTTGGNNGTATTPDALTDRSTYADLDWDFVHTWAWDATAARPALSTAPLIRIPHGPVPFAATATPPADPAAALATIAAASGAATLGVDPASSVDWGSAGSTATVTVIGRDSFVSAANSFTTATVEATPRQVAVQILPALQGDGTAGHPYEIATAADLDEAATLISHNRSYAAAHWVVTADIDYRDAVFAGIDSFTGVFDGAGHAVSDIQYAAGTSGLQADGTSAIKTGMAAFFRSIDGGTVRNLVIDHATVEGTTASGDPTTPSTSTTTATEVAGLVAYAYGATLTGNTVANSDLVQNDGNQQAGGIAAVVFGPRIDGSGRTTISGNQIWHTKITARKYIGGVVTQVLSAPADITGNFIDADMVLSCATASECAGASPTAGGVEAQMTAATGHVAVTGNVLHGGHATAGSAVNEYLDGVGMTNANPDLSFADNLVSSAFVTAGGAAPRSSDVAGTATSADDLAHQAVYTGIGWDLAGGWAWDGSKPVLPVAAPVRLARTSRTVHVSDAAPSQQDLLDYFGATVDGPSDTATLTADASAVTDWTTPGGPYPVVVTAHDHGRDSTPRTVQLTLVMSPAFTFAHPTLVYQATGTAPQDRDVIAALGVDIQVGDPDDAVTLSGLSAGDFAAPGTYHPTITVTDTAYGQGEQQFTLVVVPQVSITTAHTPTYPAGSAVTAEQVATDAGAALTDGSAPVAGTVTADVTPLQTTIGGSYPLTLSVSQIEGHDTADIIGFHADTARVDVTLTWATAPVITVQHDPLTLPKHTALPDDADLLAALGATADHGALSTDAAAVVDTDTAARYTVTITADDSDGPYAPTSSVQKATRTVTVVIPDLGGQGTAADPYRIGTAAELDAAAALVNATPGSYAGARYVLTHDIDYAGGTFATFNTFTGVFDGAGHTISNITYQVHDPGPGNPNATSATAKVPVGFFQTLTGGTVQNLTLDTVTSISPYLNAGVGGVAGFIDHGTITGVGLLNSTVTLAGTANNGNNGQAGGLVAETTAQSGAAATGTATISNSMVWNTTVTATKYPAGVITFLNGGSLTITGNLVDATLKTTAGGSGAATGFIVGQSGSSGITITGNVVYGGTATGLAASTSVYGISPSGTTNSNNYVSSSVTMAPGSGGSTSGVNGTRATVDPEAEPALPDLTAPTTYSLPPLGWNLSSLWAWDDAGRHPVLPTAPLIRFTENQAVLPVGPTAPAAADVWAAFGASVFAATDTTRTGYDDSQVHWDTPGTYPITLTATDDGQTGTPRTLSLVLAPQPVITTATTSLSFLEGDSITATDVIAATGAALNVPGTITVTGLDAATGAGDHTVELLGTDGNGLTAVPVPVSIHVAAAGPGAVIVVQHSVAVFEAVAAGGSVPTAADVLAAFQPSVAGGTGTVEIDPDSYAAIDWTAAGSHQVTLADAADGITRGATVVVTPIPVIATDHDSITLTQYDTAPTAIGLLAQTGARLTDGNGHLLNGALSVEAADIAAIDTAAANPDPGYPVRLTGTDGYGHAAAGVVVHVRVRWLGAPVITVARDITVVPYGDVAALDHAALLAALGAQTDHGTLELSYTAGTPNEHTPGAYPAVITATDDGYPVAQRAVTVVVPVLHGSGTGADPYLIGNPEELDAAADAVNDYPAAFVAATYRLTADINYRGGTFDTFHVFSGDFDGAGHSILDMTYLVNPPEGSSTNKAMAGFVQYLDGGTIENLSLNKITVDEVYLNGSVGGIAGYAHNATINRVSLLNSSITLSGTTNNGNNGQGGGFIGNGNVTQTGSGTTGTITITNSVLWNTTVSATKYAAAIITNAAGGGTITISDNLIAARVHTDSAGGGTAAIFESQGSNSGTVTISGNVVAGGDLGGKAVGYTVGGPAYPAYHYSDNLVSTAVTFAGNTTTTTTTSSNADNGTATDPAALAVQDAYTGLGWDFGQVWSWDAGAARPVLSGVPEIPVPLITLTTPRLYFQAGAGDHDDQSLLARLGASIDNGASLAVDSSQVAWGTPGTYPVTVTGATDLVSSFPVEASIVVVPVITVSSTITTVEYAAGAAVSAAQLQADAGVTLSAAGTVTVDLSAVHFDAAGTYDVPVSAVDDYGFPSPVLTLHVQVLDLDSGNVTTNPQVNPGRPAIQGVVQVGVRATATTGTWVPAAAPAYQWLRDGVAIKGATAATYTPQPADAGHLLQVQVTETPTGFAAATARSAAEPVQPGALRAGTPSITGTVRVGSRVTANPGSWSPAATAVSYQWLRNGSAIAGATKSAYTLVVADAGRSISVRVDAVRAGYVPGSATSRAVKAAPGAFTRGKPTISGTAQVGKRLTARPGGWSPTPARIGYRWLRNGVAIKGATHSTYVLVAADRGRTISVRVTAAATGYTTTTATSAGKRVAAGRLTHPAKPRITGTARVGRTIKAAAGRWSPKPRLGYQWFANGVRIKGATRASLKLAAKYRGKRISVRITGKRAGYTTVMITSARTKAVAK